MYIYMRKSGKNKERKKEARKPSQLSTDDFIGYESVDGELGGTQPVFNFIDSQKVTNLKNDLLKCALHILRCESVLYTRCGGERLKISR